MYFDVFLFSLCYINIKFDRVVKIVNWVNLKKIVFLCIVCIYIYSFYYVLNNILNYYIDELS